MNKDQNELLANVYNVLATMIPVPSEEYSTKHAYCLQSIRGILQSDQTQKDDEQ